MWQRARQLHDNPDIAGDGAGGLEFWVKEEPPEVAPYPVVIGRSGRTYRNPGLRRYETNVLDRDGQPLCMAREVVELLGERRKSVEMVKWEDFLKGQG